MTFGERLRQARKAKKLTQKELASLIKAAHNSISNWENDQNKPDPDTIQNLCWALDISPNYLLGTESPAAPPTYDLPPLPDNIIPIQMGKPLPLIGNIACGRPILAEENVEEMVACPEDIHADFCLRCKGDSMIGCRIMDGDIVYIRQQDDVDDGQIGVVIIDDEATLKRVYKIGTDRIELRPENPAFPVLTYSGEELDHIRIIGLAVAFTSAIR